MNRSLLAGALGLLAASNIFVLSHVTMNRSVSPDAELELTSRELTEAFTSSDDNSLVNLQLNWQNSAPEYRTGAMGFSDSAGWFDRKKMEEIGFDLSVPADAKDAAHHYTNARSRQVFVALEFDGPAWQEWLREREADLRLQAANNAQALTDEQFETLRQTSSRLVAIDADLDAGALRRKYPDRGRVMILPGLARVVLEGRLYASAQSPAHPPYLRGAITKISTDSINVPLPFGPLLRAIPYEPGRVIYTAALRVGSRHEPWVADLKRR